MLTDAQRERLNPEELALYEYARTHTMAEEDDEDRSEQVVHVIEQLAEARRDAERVAWLIVRQTTHFFPCLHPYDSMWCLNTDEDWFIECGPANKPPAFTTEALAIIDAAMAAEEKTT